MNMWILKYLKLFFHKLLYNMLLIRVVILNNRAVEFTIPKWEYLIKDIKQLSPLKHSYQLLLPTYEGLGTFIMKNIFC